jgi:signal transduction histidine kinase
VTSSRQTYVSHSYTRAASPQATAIAIAVPILNEQSEIQGILVVQMLVDSLVQTLNKSVGNWNGKILLFDREEHSVSGAARTEGEWVSAAAPVEALDGKVVAERNVEGALEGALVLANYAYGLAACLGLFLALAIYWILEAKHRKIESLQVEEQKQRELSQRKSDLAAYLAHEIRSPLTAVMGFADLILSGTEGPVPQAVHDDMEIVKERSQFILALVSDLLDTTKIEAGRMDVRPERFAPGPIAEKIVAALEPLGRRRNIRLSVIDTAPGVQVLADPRQVEQILSNLISNALKFTQQGEITVKIAKDKDGCLLQVSDTGPGMGPEDVKRVFERFATLRRDCTAVQRDTGLGLYLCKQLVELQKGKMWVESEKGKGTRVFFTLPV